ncbi:MAG: serine hydrolase [Gammaproteobacteria bacterium]|nr:serine hydrolase [Gammaproteobacteria bacterium]
MTDTALPLGPIGDAEALGFDPERLGRIGPAMQSYVDDRKVPNLVTLVARRGRIVHLEARGVMDFETGEPVDTSTLFRLYSSTKPLAGAATMILFEDGVLTPDESVAHWLPEYSNLCVLNESMVSERAHRGITIRDCLTNTTGLATPARAPMGMRDEYRETMDRLGWLDEPSGLSPRERVRALADLPLLAHPGDHFDYHVGYPILSAVLEEASGQTLDELFRERIFEPLGMNDSGFYLADIADGALSRFPAEYIPAEVDGTWKLICNEKADESEKHLGPRVHFGGGGDAGGVLSTIGDYARFGQMLLNGGELDGVRILGRKSVDLMVGNHTGDMVIPMTGPGFNWGLGVAVYHGRDRHPLIRSVGTYGWGGAAGTTYFADPAEDLLGVCFTQVRRHGTMPGNTYQEAFQRLVYQALV